VAERRKPGKPPGGATEAASREAIAEEQKRARQLRTAVDTACALIRQGQLTRPEGERLMRITRARALELFPDKAETFDLVLAPRFHRLLDEFTRPTARVLPFRRRGPEPTSGR
jgi:hypothetical protein